MSEMVEVRWHGRGGQGAKTASYILAVAAAEQGAQVQAFPEYGAERRGAPMKSYVRISDGPLRLRSGVKEPSIVVVLDSSLIQGENIAAGIPADGIILINGTQDPAALKQQLGLPPTVKVGVVDATTIANECIGRPIPNTPMLGALAKLSDIVSLQAAEAAVRKTLGKKLAPAVIEGNTKALQRAYEEVKVA
jgi:pyruvate ferredoxin oxidoreductase gamma subunit